MKTWQTDDTTKYFIDLRLTDNETKIIKFRHRWKLKDYGLASDKDLPMWKEKVKNECKQLLRDIRVYEVEKYFSVADANLTRSIFSTELEGTPREEKWGCTLEAVFAMEIRDLGHRLKIPAEFDRFLEYYVIYNQKKYDLIFNHGIGLSVRYRFNKEYGEIGANVCLTLGENTGSEDLDNFWEQKIKPLLINLQARIRDKMRKSKDFPILDEIVKRGAMKKNWQSIWKDSVTGKKMKSIDLDIALATRKSNELKKWYKQHPLKRGKYSDKTLSKKVKNIRYQHTKKHPLN